MESAARGRTGSYQLQTAQGYEREEAERLSEGGFDLMKKLFVALVVCALTACIFAGCIATEGSYDVVFVSEGETFLRRKPNSARRSCCPKRRPSKLPKTENNLSSSVGA